MDSSITRKAIQQLVKECVRCQASTTSLHAKTVGSSSDAELLHISCEACQGALIALVFTSGERVSSVGLVSDLSLQDVQQLHTAKPMHSDEVIQAHLFFNQGDAVHQMLEHY